MDNRDIARARAELSTFDPSGEGVLNRYLTHLEQIREIILNALRGIAPKVGSLGEFYEALVELQTLLEPVCNSIADLDTAVFQVYVSNQFSYNVMEIVLKLVRQLSKDVDALRWHLPHPSPERRVALPPPDPEAGARDSGFPSK